MRFVNKGISFFLLLTLAGCATRADLQFVQNDMDEIKNRLFLNEKNIEGIRFETKEGVSKSLKDFQQDIAAIRKGEADLQATLESAKVDMQVLAGKMDDLQNAAKKPEEDIALLKDDTDHRLKALEERLLKLEAGLDEMQKKLAASLAKEPEQTPETLYKKALEIFRGGDTQKSRELLTKFIELYPGHDLRANAHYWLGETYYSEKNFDQAILEFQQIIKNFPGKEKVPAAMLKQAMAFRELGDLKSARYVLNKLMDDHPSAEEAKMAREKLKEYK